MTLNVQRGAGLPSNFRENRAQMPVQLGAYTGVVKVNVDPARAGRVKVFIEAIDGKAAENNPDAWKTADYCPPFYGSISPQQNQAQGTTDVNNFGTFQTNPVSYGMWFTPPDIGVTVLVFFINGDASRAVYVGVIPDDQINHMVPAIGADANYELDTAGKQEILSTAKILPVTEINRVNKNVQCAPDFSNKPKPVHSIVASQFFAQGLINDNTRGPITSSSQRESPSAVYGISTPGRPIYNNSTDQNAAATSATSIDNAKNTVVVSRQGGHSFVMDDGDVSGQNNLVRVRTSAGHQITMSDDGRSIYVIHANGYSWVELGAEGTIDVFSQNSINLRSKGQINLHADKDININAGGLINMKSSNGIAVESGTDISFKCKYSYTVFSGFKLGLKSNNILTMVSSAGSWDAGKNLSLEAATIRLNSGKTDSIKEPANIPIQNLPDVEWSSQTGWTSTTKSLQTIVTRAPTHEPYVYHNTGVDNSARIARVFGDIGNADRVKFQGQIYGNNVIQVDIPPGYAIKQITPSPSTGSTATAAGNVAATVANGPADDYYRSVEFQKISLSVNQAAAISNDAIKAAGLLTITSNGQLQQLLNQTAGSLVQTPASLNRTAETINNLGYGVIPGSGAGGTIAQGITQASGAGTGIGDAISRDVNAVINGLGQIAGRAVANEVAKSLGLDKVGEAILAPIKEQVDAVLSQVGIDLKSIGGNLTDIGKSLSGEFGSLFSGGAGAGAADAAGSLLYAGESVIGATTESILTESGAVLTDTFGGSVLSETALGGLEGIAPLGDVGLDVLGGDFFSFDAGLFDLGGAIGLESWAGEAGFMAFAEEAAVFAFV